MADQQRRVMVTQFPGNLQLQQELEESPQTTSAPLEPSDNSQALDQPRSSSTDNISSTIHRETFHPLLANAQVPTTKHEKHCSHTCPEHETGLVVLLNTLVVQLLSIAAPCGVFSQKTTLFSKHRPLHLHVLIQSSEESATFHPGPRVANDP
jgi:hypothetical protein